MKIWLLLFEKCVQFFNGKNAPNWPTVKIIIEKVKCTGSAVDVKHTRHRFVIVHKSWKFQQPLFTIVSLKSCIFTLTKCNWLNKFTNYIIKQPNVNAEFLAKKTSLATRHILTSMALLIGTLPLLLLRKSTNDCLEKMHRIRLTVWCVLWSGR